ncbi:hypothetical protein KJ953_02440 [Patescibacteria group bacterium]|nr:hypothetical protein [Patescibacteria group bacterium]
MKRERLAEIGSGIIEIGNGNWLKEREKGETWYKRLGWQEIEELEKMVELQSLVWEMPVREAVPSNFLAVAEDTGGAVIASYNKDGEMNGMSFTVGTIFNKLILHMVGVDRENRYVNDLGRDMCLLQGMLAREKGVDRIDWTYDPLLGANARLYIEKLGAWPYLYTVNKYGRVPSDLYGESPTDRFTVRWDIGNLVVWSHVCDGDLEPLSLMDVDGLPVIDVTDLKKVERDRFLVQIPGVAENVVDVDKWRMGLRKVALVTMDWQADRDFGVGTHLVSGFASGMINGDRRNYYVFSRKI